jgi:endonuclease I
VLELADELQGDAGRIVTLYRNAAFAKRGGGNDFYNREHVWPNSYGFPDNDASVNYPFTDLHALFLSDIDYNFARSNHPFNYCDAGCFEFVTEANGGRGGAGGGYPGDSNWQTGMFTEGTWEVWNGRRGDVARALMYMDVRYAGMTDAWFNPATNGQGFLIVVFPALKQLFLAWFTYDVERPPDGTPAVLGEPGHRWLTAQGPYSGDTAMLKVYVSSGGVFDSAAPAVGPPVQDGTMQVRFSGCNAGVISYDIPSVGLAGEVPIQRIVLDNVALCAEPDGHLDTTGIRPELNLSISR